jgi:hypothetical protein
LPEIREDAADVAAREAAKRQAAAEEEFKRASQALQRGLPLPRALNRDILRTGKAKDDVQVKVGRCTNTEEPADLIM